MIDMEMAVGDEPYVGAPEPVPREQLVERPADRGVDAVGIGMMADPGIEQEHPTWMPDQECGHHDLLAGQPLRILGHRE